MCVCNVVRGIRGMWGYYVVRVFFVSLRMKTRVTNGQVNRKYKVLYQPPRGAHDL